MNTVQLTTSFRTTPNTAMAGQQVNPVQAHQDTPCKAHLESCMHVHQPMSQVCKPGESLALRKVKYPLNGRTSVSRLPLTKQDILSQYSGCFEGIGHFPGDQNKISTKHGKYAIFPSEPVPARKEIHVGNQTEAIRGYRYIYIRNDQLSEQVLCTQCTHTSGYRLQAREGSSGELPMTEDGNFQYEGTSILQHHC